MTVGRRLPVTSETQLSSLKSRRPWCGSRDAVCGPAEYKRPASSGIRHQELRRLYREEGLQVRKRGGRKRALESACAVGAPLAAERALVAGLRAPTHSLTAAGSVPCGRRRLTRECLALVADTSLSGAGVARELDAIIAIARQADDVRFRQRPTSGSLAPGATTDLHSLTVVSVRSTSSKRLPPSRNKLSSIANTGSVTRYIGPHRPQHEMQFQAEDPSIIYRVADAPSRHLLREVLPLGIGPSTNGR